MVGADGNTSGGRPDGGSGAAELVDVALER